MQAEGADAELVLAAGDPERSLVLALLADSERHAGHREVRLREEARAARLRVVDDLVDVRRRLRRPQRDGLEPAAVRAGAPRPVRLPRKGEAHDGAMQPWSGSKAAGLRRSLGSPCDRRFIGRERGVGGVPVRVTMRNSKAGPRSEVRGIPVVNRQRERRPAGGGECDAAESGPTSSAVPSASVVPVSARPASVSLAHTAEEAAANTAKAVGRRPGGHRRARRPSVGVGRG